MVELLESARRPLEIAGGAGHKIGSHRGGGPFHRSSTSQVKTDLPTTTNPSRQEYSTLLR